VFLADLILTIYIPEKLVIEDTAFLGAVAEHMASKLLTLQLLHGKENRRDVK